MVSDNGNGFPLRVSGKLDLENIPRIGMGLPNLLARAEKLGGSLFLDSFPGEGTTIRLEVEIQE